MCKKMKKLRPFFLFFMLNFSFPILHSAAHAAAVALPATGQTTCYDAVGAVIACAGTGQDGDKLAGVAWPNPRFTDNNNGTITDNLTGLIWLKNANCTDTVGSIDKSNGYLPWADALTWSNNLASGACGLTDGSSVGQWRLPNIVELESLVDAEQLNPALPFGHPFGNAQTNGYWSSSPYYYDDYAWVVYLDDGSAFDDFMPYSYYVWPVRGGQ